MNVHSSLCCSGTAKEHTDTKDSTKHEESPYLQLLAQDIDHLSSACRLCRGKDAEDAGLIVQAADGSAVHHPGKLVEHPCVQPRVHALACQHTAVLQLCMLCQLK